MADLSLTYKVTGPTLRDFHRSRAFVRLILGPVGSGKTTACVMELLLKASMQAPGPDGKRRSRWAVLRNTAPELVSTTIKSFVQWMPEGVGRWNYDSPITFTLKRGDIEAEFLFIALDSDDDIRKLLSLELTGAYTNELRELRKSVLDALTGRVGRYPPIRDGGPTWHGIICDTNMPDREHYIYRLAEVDQPEGFAFFHQPAGDGPDAENLENLPANYYRTISAGKDVDWIAVYVKSQYAFLIEGKPVFPSFRDSTHVALEPIPALPRIPLVVGVDYGLTPAAAICQRTANGRWLVIDELVTDNTGVTRFAELLTAHIRQRYPDHDVRGWGDPAGAQRAQTDERSCLQIMNANTPWPWVSAPDNGLQVRLEAVKGALNRMVDGAPGFLLSPTCSHLRKGFAGGYHYRLARTGGGVTYHETPNKNEYSHVMDALQYSLSGNGEGAVVLGAQRYAGAPKFADSEYNMYET